MKKSVLNLTRSFLQVINLMVAAAWKTATSKQLSLTIYNCCTGEKAPITWSRLVQLAIENMRIHPLGMITTFNHKFLLTNCLHYRGCILVSHGNFETKSSTQFNSCSLGTLHSCIYLRYSSANSRQKTNVKDINLADFFYNKNYSFID